MRLLARAALAGFTCALLGLGCGDDEEQAGGATSATTTEAPSEPDAEPAEGETAEERREEAPPPEQLERPLSVEDVMVAVLTRSGSPEQGCEELVTERFVREAYGSRQACVAARQPGALAESLAIAEVDEAGDTAAAVAIPSGGPYDGIEVEVGLRADPEADGAWLVDSLFADVPAGP